MPQSFTKDPQDVLDYLFDFSDDMAADGDTIANHTIEIDGALTLDSESRTTTGVTVWLSGGTLGQQVKVDCLAITSAGREFNRKAIFVIQDM